MVMEQFRDRENKLLLIVAMRGDWGIIDNVSGRMVVCGDDPVQLKRRSDEIAKILDIEVADGTGILFLDLLSVATERGL